MIQKSSLPQGWDDPIDPTKFFQFSIPHNILDAKLTKQCYQEGVCDSNRDAHIMWYPFEI